MAHINSSCLSEVYRAANSGVFASRPGVYHLFSVITILKDLASCRFSSDRLGNEVVGYGTVPSWTFSYVETFITVAGSVCGHNENDLAILFSTLTQNKKHQKQNIFF